MAFSKNTFAFDLDIKRQSKTKVFPVEGDTANQFVITLKDNGAAMNLTGLYVRAVYKRSDGVVVTQGETHPDAPLTVNKASGIVTVNVMNGAFRDGDNYLELQVLSGSATSGAVMVTSPQVLLRARNCILTDDAVAASSEISELNEYLAALAGMNITVTMLAASASPTGSITLEDGAYQIALGIPRGAKITSASLSGTTLTFSLDDGSSVTVSLTGIATQSWVNSQDFLTSPVENSDLDTMAPLTIKGNNTQSTRAPKDLSKAEIKAMFPMVGATNNANGSAGFVPAPTSGDKDFFLAGDGTWKEPSSEQGELKIKVDNTVVTLTSLSTGDYLSKAMTFINLLIANKQNTLTAGYGIAISGQNNNNISAPYSPVIVTVNDATLSDIVGHATAGRIVVCEKTVSGANVRGLLRYYDDTSAVFYDVDADNTQATMWVVDSNDDWTESTVSLGGGGGGKDPLIAVYDSTSYATIAAAVAAGKMVCVDLTDGRAYYAGVDSRNTAAYFTGISSDHSKIIYASVASAPTVGSTGWSSGSVAIPDVYLVTASTIIQTTWRVTDRTMAQLNEAWAAGKRLKAKFPAPLDENTIVDVIADLVQLSIGSTPTAYVACYTGVLDNNLSICSFWQMSDNQANVKVNSIASDSTPAALGTASAGTSIKYARADHVHPLPSASDVGAYVKPAGGIPASDLASGVIPTVPSASSATPSMDGTGAAGSSTDYARADHVHPSDTSKADKPKYTTLTLAVADWSAVTGGYSCSKTVTGLTATSIVWLSYSDTETEFSESQSANTLTFAVADLPSAAITVNVAFMEGSAL